MEDLKLVNLESGFDWTFSGQAKGRHVADEEHKSNEHRASLICLICVNEGVKVALNVCGNS